MTKTLKPWRTSRPEEIQTDIAPQALTNEDMSKLIKNETDTNVKTGYFDFKTGKVILDKWPWKWKTLWYLTHLWNWMIGAEKLNLTCNACFQKNLIFISD